jgi:hypothetical protein
LSIANLHIPAFKLPESLNVLHCGNIHKIEGNNIEPERENAVGFRKHVSITYSCVKLAKMSMHKMTPDNQGPAYD